MNNNEKTPRFINKDFKSSVKKKPLEMFREDEYKKNSTLAKDAPTRDPRPNDNQLLISYMGNNYYKFLNSPFNFSAFFFGGIYYFFRKMALEGIIITILQTIIIAFSKNYIIPTIFMFLLGFITNPLYLTISKNKVKAIKNNNNPDFLNNICLKKGGTSTFQMLMGLLLSSIILGTMIYLKIIPNNTIFDIITRLR